MGVCSNGIGDIRRVIWVKADQRPAVMAWVMVATRRARNDGGGSSNSSPVAVPASVPGATTVG